MVLRWNITLTQNGFSIDSREQQEYHLDNQAELFIYMYMHVIPHYCPGRFEVDMGHTNHSWVGFSKKLDGYDHILREFANFF